MYSKNFIVRNGTRVIFTPAEAFAYFNLSGCVSTINPLLKYVLLFVGHVATGSRTEEVHRPTGFLTKTQTS